MLFLIIAGIAALEFFLIFLYRKKGHFRLFRSYRVLLFFFILVVSYITVFQRDSNVRTGIMLIPFWSYKKALHGIQTGSYKYLREIVLNILLFMPMGVLTVFMIKSPLTTKKLFFLFLPGFFFSLSIESVQYFFKLGVFEIDDLIDNSIGFAAGMMVSVISRKWTDILMAKNGKQELNGNGL